MTVENVTTFKLWDTVVSLAVHVGLCVMGRSRTFQERVWKVWYNFLTTHVPTAQREWNFMNYSYEPADPKDRLKAKTPKEKPELHSMQLYHHAAAPSKVQWAGKEVLEVGCGRGGGAAFLTQDLKPKSYVALDFADKQVERSQRVFADIKNLTFKCGNAMSLPFEDNSFDIVLNVESSHVYSDFSKFAQEVFRVLRPGGVLCWTDFRGVAKIPGLEECFKAVGFDDVTFTDITENVVRGLKASTVARNELIDSYFQWNFLVLRNLGAVCRELARNFAGSEGSDVYNKFESKAWVYKSGVFRKP